MLDPDEYPISGVASTVVQVVEFGFPAVEINFVNDGGVSIFVSFVSDTAAGFEIKTGEVRSWGQTASKRGRQRMWLKTSTSTCAFHGEALR